MSCGFGKCKQGQIKLGNFLFIVTNNLNLKKRDVMQYDMNLMTRGRISVLGASEF